MQSLRKVVVVSLVWAVALISSSYFLRGAAIGEWVDAFLYLAAGVWVTSTWLGRRIPGCRTQG